MFTLTVPVDHAHASNEPGNIIFILDASGSMWGQIGGVNKIVIAKEVMTQLVKDLPDGLNVGLVAYGHRQKKDCRDVETLVSLAPLDRAKLNGAIKAIQPRGMTPITFSIGRTIEDVKSINGRRTIVLVSDGKETCDGDPCELTRQLRESGIEFTLHVVGFDVDAKTTEQLECIAEAGGGTYHGAADAEKLKSALTDVIRKAVATNLVVLGFGPDEKPLSVRVNVLDQGGSQVATDAGKKVGFGLPAGSYALDVRAEALSETIRIESVTVTEDEVMEQKVVFASARIAVSLKNDRGAPVNGYVRIVDEATGQYAEQGDIVDGRALFEVSPGTYRLIMECADTGSKIKTDVFSIDPGCEKSIEGKCANSRIGVTVKDGAGNSIVGYVRIVDVAADSYTDEGDAGPEMRTFEVPPGTYKVDVECPGPDAKRVRSDPFDIQPGGEVKRVIVCP
jgi:Ca-activated chloride channel family protein